MTAVAPERTRRIPEWLNDEGIPLPLDVDPRPWGRSKFLQPDPEPVPDPEPPRPRSFRHRIAAYNVWRLASDAQTVEDFNRIIGMFGVVGWSEARMSGKGEEVKKLSTQAGWKFWKGEHGTDTAISWDAKRYSDWLRDSLDIADSWWRGKSGMPVAVPYVGLRDRDTGEEFIVLCAHTQVRGSRDGKKYAPYRRSMRKQYRAIKKLIARLKAEHGCAVFLVGDLNNGKALQDKIAPAEFTAFAHRIDYIVYDEELAELVEGVVHKGIGFDHKRDKGDGPMHSDHPLVGAEFTLTPRRTKAA